MLDNNDLFLLGSTKFKLFNIIKSINPDYINKKTDCVNRTFAQILYHLDYFEKAYFSINLRNIIYKYDLYTSSFNNEVNDIYDYNMTDIYKLYETIKLEREQNICLLQNADVKDWDTYMEHKERGRINLDTIISNVIKHDQIHIEQLVNIIGEVK